MKTTDIAGDRPLKDPVCGMTVPAESPHRYEHEGTEFLFCCQGCLEKFKAAPVKFLDKAEATPALSQIGNLQPIGMSPSGATATLEIDPVCKMKVGPDAAKGEFPYGGKTYYFCCTGCLDKFKSDPERYLAVKDHTLRDEGTQAADAIYTCPMHPEIRQKGPGACPKCGMALEPEIVTAEETANPELEDMTRRFWIATILSVPVLALDMMETGRWIQFALGTPVVVWAGWPLFERAWA